MFTLFVSLFSLFLGLWIAPKLMHYTKSLSLFEGFLSVFIGGLVLFHIFPHSFSDVGYWALPLFVFGALIPLFLERTQRSSVLSLIFLGVGFSIHAFMDGLGLQLHEALPLDGHLGHAHEHEHEQTTLVWAILAHRIPVGIFLGCTAITKPKLSFSFAILISLATVSGFLLGGTIPYIGAVQAVIGGALLHVIAGHRIVDPHIEQKTSIRILGALTAGLFLFFMSDGHMESTFLEVWSFVSLCFLSYLSIQIPNHACNSCEQKEILVP